MKYKQVHRQTGSLSISGYRFNVSGGFSGVCQDVADFVDGGIEAVIDINEGAGPEAILNRFPGDDLPRVFQQHR